MKISTVLFCVSVSIITLVIGNNLYALQIVHPAWLLLAAVVAVCAMGFEYNNS